VSTPAGSTASVSAPPKRMRRQAMIMRMVNVPMRRILALPFRTPLSKNLMLLYLTGRRTGKSYRQPVSYVRHDGTLLTPGGGKWKLNLDPGRQVKIRLGGHDILARPDLVADVDEVDRLLMIMTEANPRTASFIPIPRREDGHFERAGLANAISHGFRIVRWHLPEP
jgi:deazaflavin-dependent oxidoreductase (nitroreductase family)